MLSISQTFVTDKGLKELAVLTNLTFLNLESAKVSDEGVAEIRKSLPKCEVRY